MVPQHTLGPVGDVGAGVMGATCGQIALRNGAQRVFALDLDEQKVNTATALGMEGVKIDETDPISFVESETDGVGADVVFEAVGGAQSHVTEGSDPLAQAFKLVRKGGKLVHISHTSSEVSLSPGAFRDKMVDWINPRDGGVFQHGPNATTGTVAADMVANGHISIDDYITHELDGLESFERAVEMTSNKGQYGAMGPVQLSL